MLGGWIETLLPESGTNTTTVKPINEGEFHTVVEEQPASGSVWGFLDGLGDQVSEGVGGYIKGKVEKELGRQTFGPEASQDTTGDPNYNAGQVGKTQAAESFGTKYQKPLLIGAGVLTGVLVLSMVLRR